MQYHHIPFDEMQTFCRKAFAGYGFNEDDCKAITNVLLDADLSGIESHGVQRLVRYHHEITSGMVNTAAESETVFETPLSAVLDGHDCMGQTLGVRAMKMAIEKAKKCGIGFVSVRNSNHYGIAGYYAKMAMREGLMGVCMTNSESIMVPTFGKQAMIGTNPIAVAMPAEPAPFVIDAATTVVPRGKLEVYAKRGNGIPDGWALDENGQPSSDSERVLSNIISKAGGGILPLGGAGDMTSGYKGYGFGLLCEIFTSVFSNGTTSNYIYKTPTGSGICQFYGAIDYGMFGDRKQIESRLSAFLQEIRDSAKADGQSRIYIHGEKELEARERVLREGIPVNDKTYAEMQMIADYTGSADLLPKYAD